jgi:hypothetical protein
MNEKYLIRLGEVDALAFRYNLAERQAMIGGANRLREDMECIIEEYFRVPVPEPTFPTRRKIRYNWRMSKTAFDAGYKRMKDNGMIERVKDHGRIVR